jgi:hypothetical protein
MGPEIGQLYPGANATGFNTTSFFGPGAMGTSLGRLPSASGSVSFGGPQEQMFNNTMLANLQVLQQLLALLTAMLISGAAAGLLGGQSAAGGNSTNPVSDTSGGAPASVTPSGSPGSSPTGAASDPSAASPVSQAAPTQPGQGASPVNIGPGTKVLEIGDSHTVGVFGDELDNKLRGTGAQVATYASAGASADWFVKGTATKYGYSERHADGSKSTTPYGQSHATPKLEQLIAKEKPQVIVVNLGANFRGAGPAGIKQQVSSLGEIAKKHNIPIVWVGPPKSQKDNANSGSLQKFDQDMAAAVAPYGSYVASTPFVPKYVGSDGLHFGGAEGTKIAKGWANGVFQAITGK